MLLINEDFITTDRIDVFCKNGVEVYTLRTDKIHPVVSGNKWFKLKLYLQQAKQHNTETIVTYGGAYSNHIVATAFACQQQGFKSIGIIRGEEPKNYSHTLKNALDYGMQLHFLSRQDYKEKTLPAQFNDEKFYEIPEGGYGELGAAGIATIQYDKKKFDWICCAVGSGTMMAGFINSKNQSAQVVGISVLKNNFDLETDVHRLLTDKKEKKNINHDYHFGGYAKYNSDLISFMNQFYVQTNIPTDFVYSAKLFYGVNALIDKKYFQRGSKILVIHCGGLQGNLSLPKGTLIF